MKFQAFRVQNFRSIKDSSWQSLSLDNINGLIGQNESGKTSLLDSLVSFINGNIYENDIRSDGTFPEVHCSFEINPDKLAELVEDYVLPDGALDLIKSNGNRINLNRTWSTAKESILSLEEQNLKDLFKTTPEPAIEVAAVTDEGQSTEPSEGVQLPQEEPKIPAISEEEFVKLLIPFLPSFDLFEDLGSLLPDSIDLADIKNKKTKTVGYKGAINFLEILGIELDFLESENMRQVTSEISKLNKKMTGDFRDFWSQKIGKTNKIEIEFELKNHSATSGGPIGEPYLIFWINDGPEKLSPQQRSKGVRWFVSFYLELKAQAERQAKNPNNNVLLIDEPGGSLHAKAQEDVLKVFEEIKDSFQIIYTTHSPYLIKLETLYRLLAIQREDAEDDKSDTIVLSAQHLGSATSDTLSPIYSLMGIDFCNQTTIKQKNNVILEEVSAFYYLTAFKILVNSKKEMNCLPATGAPNIPLLANLLLGWGIDFSVFVDDDASGRDVYNRLKKDLFNDVEDDANKKLLKNSGFRGIEDMFTKKDFRTHVLENSSLTYAEENSEYMKSSRLSKPIVATKFMLNVKEKKIKLDELDVTTQSNIKEVIKRIEDSF